MKKLFTLFFLLFNVVGAKSAEFDFDAFVEERMQHNNFILVGAKGTVITMSLPDTFFPYPKATSFSRTANSLELLEDGYDFTNFKKLIGMHQAIYSYNPTVEGYLKFLKESKKSGRTCPPKARRMTILEKGDNELIYMSKCGQLKEGAIPDQQGLQGETVLTRVIFSKNQALQLLYAFRGDSFNVKKSTGPMSEEDYNFALKTLKSLIMCDSYTKSGLCDHIFYGNPDNYSGITYKLPKGYVLNNNLAKQYDADKVFTKTNGSLEKGDVIITVKQVKSNQDFDVVISNFVAGIQRQQGTGISLLMINNLRLYKTAINGFVIAAPDKPYNIVFVGTKDGYSVIKIFVKDKESLQTRLVNDFINSIKMVN